MDGGGRRSDGRARRGVRLRRAVTPREAGAIGLLLRRVRAEVRARLVHAALFGSKARGDARADSDVDVLLVFHSLPPDREPQATHAEEIAGEVADRTGVPVTVWSVSLPDLRRGARTPMLVDALDDSIPLWWEVRPLGAVPFTPEDAARCVRALLARVAEGGGECARRLAGGDDPAALRRLRDDLVRLATAHLLLDGVTRPRRGEAIDALLARRPPPALPAAARRVLGWAAAGFGPDGRDEEAALAAPPGGWPAAARAVDALRAPLLRPDKHLAGKGPGWGTSGAVAHTGMEGTRLAR